MKIEQLTDDERDELAPPGELSCVGHVGHKAIRIIDAQAAVIERVRAVMLADARHIDQLTRRHLNEALASAPERTAPVCPVHGDECLGLGDDCRPMASGYPAEPQVRPGRHAQLRAAYRALAAANARVAELEYELDGLRMGARVIESQRDAANARADAAERRHQGAEAVCVQQRAELALAEERVKAANARADAAESEKDRIVTYHCQQIHQSNVAVDRAESEAAALRARIQAVLALCRDVNERSTRDPNAVSIIAVRAALAQ